MVWEKRQRILFGSENHDLNFLYMRILSVFMYGVYTVAIYVYNHRHTMSVTDVVQPLWRVVCRSRYSAQTSSLSKA